MDEDLVARMCAGDEAALETLLTELVPVVRQRLARLLGRGPELDDAVQDALIELARALPRYEGRSSLTTYVHIVTTRVGYRYFRRPPSHPSIELVPEPADKLDPESRAMDREVLRRLSACLERMPETHRMAFLLCGVEGLSSDEAAELEQTTSQAIRSRLMRARRLVLDSMSNDPYVARLLMRVS